ncbi:hypothetical protein [Solicola gregarius]|uniref:Transmembrane protein n=1 Tax=Solicola gregarius TaxID=2908642 RepID=A0AA46TIU5_9ACTN|nr:hypothetical protein [Solicola gregarius]UYM06142.1 hypothetical protein L0C25_03455 [Solicola gregarius]
MLEHSYWVPYLCVAIAWGIVGLALLAHRAGSAHPPETFPAAAVGFVGAGAVSALLAAVAYSRDRSDGFLAIFVLAGLLTPVIGWVATLFANEDEDEGAGEV